MNSNHYYRWLIGLAGAELVSWFVFWGSGGLTKESLGGFSLMNIFFVLLIIISFFLAFYRPSWLALMSLAELVIGGKGYLFFLQLSGQKISIRLLLFVLLFIAWGVKLLRQRRWNFPRQWLWPLSALTAWVIIMSGVGLLRGNSPGNIFLDMNGYLYLAIALPWWTFFKDKNFNQKILIPVILAGITLIGLKSWLMQALFAHDLAFLPRLYQWIRQTGIGEITLINKNVYRIFFQSQIYTFLGFLFILVALLRGQVQRWWTWAWLGSSLGIIISLSRSFWLGAAVAFVVLLWLLLRQRQWLHLRRLWVLIPAGLFVWLATTWAQNFPYIWPPPGHTNGTSAVAARLHSTGSSEASTARHNQIPPLVQAIRKNPITGQGFGTQVTYYSSDPRIRGNRTTSAFELGYLDQWLDLGFIGLVLLGWLLWTLLRRAWLQPQKWMWLVPTIGLMAVHATSPYLNHPLGLGWLALVGLAVYDHVE